MNSNQSPLPLTPDQKCRYVQERFAHCPYCDSDQIEGGPIDIDGKRAVQAVTCLACGERWHDVYVLTDVE